MDNIHIRHEDVASSNLFKFVVGPDEREFFMHSALAASQSQPLKTLIYGEMAEARDGHVVWDDISEATFILFSQYAYTGDYESVEPTLEDPPENDDSSKQIAQPMQPRAATNEMQDIDMENFIYFSQGTSSTVGNRPRPSRRDRRLREFSNLPRTRYQLRETLLAVAGPHSGVVRTPTFKPRENKEFEDFTDVFLSHAKLYIFADRYQISGLQVLSLARLASTLSAFTLFKRRHKDILRLLEFCYDDEPVPDKLKDLVVLYAASQMRILMASDDFQQFYGSHGELSIAVTELLLQGQDS